MTTPESFWKFAIRTYRCEGVADTCLALQDECGADVNVLLFCCWMGATRGEIETDTFNSVLEFSRAWADHVVRPLRSVRTWMKSDGCHVPAMPVESCMNLRERIKKVELESEQMQENVMQAMVDHTPMASLGVDEQSSHAMFNLRRYCEAEGIEWSRETKTRLGLILRAAIPPVG